MVERRTCSFCGQEIEPGTGRIHVKKDGTVYNFCTSKCFKNMIELRRVPRRTAWTAQFYREKEAKLKTAAAHTAKKVKKGEAAREPEADGAEEVAGAEGSDVKETTGESEGEE